MFTKNDIENDLRALGLSEGDTINVKASLGSIGQVKGGANTLIEALIAVVGDTGTVVTDSFVNCYPLPLDKNNEIQVSDKSTPSYAGALANAMINHPKSIRSRHPIQKFAAIGYRAEELMLNHDENSYAYDVLKKLIHTGGKNLKIGSDEKVYGIGTTHVAIGELGFRQKSPHLGVKFKDSNGDTHLFHRNWAGAGHGFNKFMPLYQRAGAILSQGYVGFAPSKITDMRITYDVEVQKLREDPSFQLCSDPLCVECRLSWEFSSQSLFGFICTNLFKISPSILYRAVLTKLKYKYHGR